MASFIAKQLVGKQLDSVKGALGDKKEEGATESKSEIDPEVEAALKEAEDRRQEKHRKMEEERETMRQGIRDKYGLKKKEDPAVLDEFGGAAGDGNKLGRKRKTPAELAAEAAAAEEEEESILGFLPPNVRDMAKSVTDAPKQLMTDASEKCSLM